MQDLPGLESPSILSPLKMLMFVENSYYRVLIGRSPRKSCLSSFPVDRSAQIRPREWENFHASGAIHIFLSNRLKSGLVWDGFKMKGESMS